MSSTEFTGIRFTRMCGAAVTLRRNPGSDTGVFRGIYSLEDLGAARIRLSASSTSFPRVIGNYDSSAQRGPAHFASKIRGSANRKHGGMDPAFLPFYLCGVSIRRGRVCFRFVAALA